MNLDPHQRAAIEAHHRAEAAADAEAAEASALVADTVDGWAPIARLFMRRFVDRQDYLPTDEATSRMLRLAAGDIGEDKIRAHLNASLQELLEENTDRETWLSVLQDDLVDLLFPNGFPTDDHADAWDEWFANIWEVQP